MLLVFFQNFVGINTIIYYAPTLLTDVGFGATDAIGANVAIGAVNMLMTLPGMWLIDRAGRRPLLRWGAVGMCLAMIVLAVTNLVGLEQGPLLLGLTLAGIVVYIASFSISWGPVQWVLLPELFPVAGPRRRGRVLRDVQLAVQHDRRAAVPVAARAFGAGWNFLFFAVTTAAAYLYATRLLPETKGRSLEEIEKDLAGPVTAWPAVRAR